MLKQVAPTDTTQTLVADTAGGRRRCLQHVVRRILCITEHEALEQSLQDEGKLRRAM